MAASFHFSDRPLLLSLLGLWLSLPFSAAWALEEAMNIPCELAENGTLHIDGMLSDWQGVQAVEVVGVAQSGAKAALGA